MLSRPFWRVLVSCMALMMGSISLFVSADPETSDVPVWPEHLGGSTVLPVDPETIPLTWSKDQNIAWKAELNGAGQSSPVIWGKRLFVTSISGSMKEHSHVTAIDLETGAILWQRELPASQPVRANFYQARAAPSPTVDAKAVYAFFETGDLVALSHDGEQLWHRSIVADYGPFESNIGLASSTVQTENAVVVLVDHEGPSYLAAFDKANGELMWMAERSPRRSYASPALVPVGKSHHIVVSSAGSVDGYHPGTGEVLWSFEEVGGNRSAKPVSYRNGHFLVAASGGMHGEFLEDAQRSNLSMSIAETENGFEATVDWRAEKAIPDFSSPTVYRGCAYWVTRVGIVYCFDPKTGEKKYAERLSGGRNWATPLGVGERVYFFGKSGTTDVIAAGPEFRALAQNRLWHLDDQDPEASPGGHRGSESGTRNSLARSVNPTTGTTDRGAKRRERSQASGDGPRRGRNGKMFDDPTQYAAAAVDGSLVIRTGQFVYCLRKTQAES